MAAGYIFSFLTGKRRVINNEILQMQILSWESAEP